MNYDAKKNENDIFLKKMELEPCGLLVPVGCFGCFGVCMDVLMYAWVCLVSSTAA